MTKISLLEKELKEHLKGEVGQAERSPTRMMRSGGFKTGLLHIHLGGHGLRVLIDSCKLHNSRLYCACLPRNSLCSNQMYVYMNINESLMGLPLPKVT